ncbi:MAG: lactonase family protein [Pirellulales bacterium]|nr:lactonase family protein [Pirellulales bacterium]
MNTNRVYVGTYTGQQSKGIYVFDFDPASGKAGQPSLAAEVADPSFLELHPNGKFLYCVDESLQQVKDGPLKGSAVDALAIDSSSGKLTLLNRQAAQGDEACFVSLDGAGKFVLVASYTSGEIAVLPVDDDGRLKPASAHVKHQGSSVDESRQKEPHAHSIKLDPSGRFALAADLGTDRIYVYKFNPKDGTLTPNDPPAGIANPGSGPRHFSFHPSGKYVYVINEMGMTVTAYSWNSENGEMKPIQTIRTVPAGVSGSHLSTAEVLVHRSGKFLYGSNRGHDSIATFSIDPATGNLTPTGHFATGGKTPRHFNIDPTGQWLLAANQDSGTIHVFRIDPQTGKLTPNGEVIEVPAPVCVKFNRPQ